MRQYLYVCTSKASKSSSHSSTRGAIEGQKRPATAAETYSSSGVSICIVVLVKHVNCVPVERDTAPQGPVFVLLY